MIAKNFYWIVCCSNIIGALLHASGSASEGSDKAFDRGNIIIIIDTSEKGNKNGLGAMQQDLHDAIISQSAPILVSTSLLNSIFFNTGINMAVSRHSTEVFKNDSSGKPKAFVTQQIEAGEALNVYRDLYIQAVHILETYDTAQPRSAVLERLAKLSEAPALRTIAPKYKTLKRDFFNTLWLAEFPFNVNEWSSYVVDSNFCIMIPYAYLKSKNIPFASHDDLVQNALKLGLNVDKWTKIQDVYFEYFVITQRLARGLPLTGIAGITDEIARDETRLWQKIEERKALAYPTTASDTLADLSKVFITKDAYKNKKSTPVAWSIYVTGHGLLHTAIIGLPFPEFQSMLIFLENRINTNLLFYSSCYAGITTAKAIYDALVLAEKAATTKDQSAINMQVDGSFSFPIITSAIFDNVVSTQFDTKVGVEKYTTFKLQEADIDWDHKRFIITATMSDGQQKPVMADYKSFFKAIDDTPYGYFAIANSIVKNQDVPASLIRRPETNFFVPNAPSICSLGKIASQYRSASSKPLDYTKCSYVHIQGPVTLAPVVINSETKIVPATTGTYYLDNLKIYKSAFVEAKNIADQQVKILNQVFKEIINRYASSVTVFIKTVTFVSTDNKELTGDFYRVTNGRVAQEDEATFLEETNQLKRVSGMQMGLVDLTSHNAINVLRVSPRTPLKFAKKPYFIQKIDLRPGNDSEYALYVDGLKKGDDGSIAFLLQNLLSSFIESPTALFVAKVSVNISPVIMTDLLYDSTKKTLFFTKVSDGTRYQSVSITDDNTGRQKLAIEPYEERNNVVYDKIVSLTKPLEASNALEGPFTDAEYPFSATGQGLKSDDTIDEALQQSAKNLEQTITSGRKSRRGSVGAR